MKHESTRNNSVEWYTPPWVFEAIALGFDLDPCHPEGDRLPWVPARKVYTKADDGLAQPWAGRVWLNPPYGKEAERWLAKMHEHRHGLALLFSRTDNGWFHEYAAHADAIFFFRKRIQFVDRSREPPVKDDGRKADSPGAGSMLVAWGPDCVAALHRLELAGLGYVFGRHRSRWLNHKPATASSMPFRWIRDLTLKELSTLLEVIYHWRQYFGEGPRSNIETQEWALELHKRLRGEKDARRGKSVS